LLRALKVSSRTFSNRLPFRDFQEDCFLPTPVRLFRRKNRGDKDWEHVFTLISNPPVRPSAMDFENGDCFILNV